MATLCLELHSLGSYSPSLTSLFSLSTSFSVREDSKVSFTAPFSSGDSFGQSGSGGTVGTSFAAVVAANSFSLRVSPFIIFCGVMGKNCILLKVSPEKVAIQASTDKERNISKKYFPLRKILQIDGQEAISEGHCREGTVWFIKSLQHKPCHQLHPIVFSKELSNKNNACFSQENKRQIIEEHHHGHSKSTSGCLRVNARETRLVRYFTNRRDSL